MENNSLHLDNNLSNQGTEQKHNATLTQKLSWAEVQSSGLNIKQNMYVLSYMKLHNEPLCCRDLEVLTGIRTSSLTRVLNDLKNQKLILVAKLDKSIHSKKIVEYYTISNDYVSLVR